MLLHSTKLIPIACLLHLFYTFRSPQFIIPPHLSPLHLHLSLSTTFFLTPHSYLSLSLTLSIAFFLAS